MPCSTRMSGASHILTARVAHVMFYSHEWRILCSTHMSGASHVLLAWVAHAMFYSHECHILCSTRVQHNGIKSTIFWRMGVLPHWNDKSTYKDWRLNNHVKALFQSDGNLSLSNWIKLIDQWLVINSFRNLSFAYRIFGAQLYEWQSHSMQTVILSVLYIQHLN